MKEKIELIRNLVGEGETEAALDALEQLFQEAESPLRDDALLLRGRFKKWDREQKMGLAPAYSEQNAVVLAVLDLLKQAEKGRSKSQNPVASSPVFGQNQPPVSLQNLPPNQAGFVGRFFIDGDPFEYYLASTDQIFRLDPATRQPLQIAQKFGSNDPRFAWTYFVPALNAWASVDFQGSIWMLNFFGVVVRVGHFQGF